MYTTKSMRACLKPALLVSTNLGMVNFLQKDALCAASASRAPLDITLYKYKTCPFCNRVKAVLDFLDLPYTEVEVNPLTKGQLGPLGLEEVSFL